MRPFGEWAAPCRAGTRRAWRIGVRVLNVTGNSARASPGIEELAIAFLAEVFQHLRDAD